MEVIAKVIETIPHTELTALSEKGGPVIVRY